MKEITEFLILAFKNYQESVVKDRKGRKGNRSGEEEEEQEGVR